MLSIRSLPLQEDNIPILLGNKYILWRETLSLPFMDIHITNVLEKIAHHKKIECLCPQDKLKCEENMENTLSVFSFAVKQTLEDYDITCAIAID